MQWATQWAAAHGGATDDVMDSSAQQCDGQYDRQQHMVARQVSLASRVESHGFVVWLWTGVSLGNQPTFDTKNAENTVGITRRLGCLECLGRLSWMPWESPGILEIARVTKVLVCFHSFV